MLEFIKKKNSLFLTLCMRLPIKLPVQYFVPTLLLPFCVYVITCLLPLTHYSFIIAGKLNVRQNCNL